MTLLWIVIGVAVVTVFSFICITRRDAGLQRSGVLPARGQATMADVERLVQSGQRIAAIRVYREIHRVGLAEAKKAVEDLHPSA